MDKTKEKVPVFAPCKHHAGENVDGLGWDATDEACQECLIYFPSYAETCKSASDLRKRKGSVQFVEAPKVEKELTPLHKSYSTAEEALEEFKKTKDSIETSKKGGEEEVATKVVKEKTTIKKTSLEGKKKAVKKEGHSFRPGTARGEIHAMLSKGMAVDKVIERVIEKYGYKPSFAKSKVLVVQKLGNL